MQLQKIFLHIFTVCIITVFNTYADDDTVVTVNPPYTFELGFRALIVKPMASNLHYAAQADPLPLVSPHWIIHDIHPKYHFGFDLEFSFFFHNLDSRLYANYERFHACDTACVNVGSENMVGPFFEIGPDASAYSLAEGRVNFQLDEVNGTYGQNVNFGSRLRTTLFAGVSFARIKENLTFTYSNTDGTITRTIQIPSQFSGAGPQFGIDFIYHIICGLQFTGKATASLLTGKSKNHTCYTSISPFLELFDQPSPNEQSTSVCNRTQVVPVFNERIGAAYAYEFCNHYLIKIEVGYQAQIYLGALQSVDIGSEVVTPPILPDTVGVFARTFQRTISNFALAGPYVTLDLGF